jgi:hypothetical protein
MNFCSARLAAALMMSALGLAGANGWPRLVAKDDPSLIQIVGCHLNGDTVSGGHSDPVFLHAARGVGNDGMPIVHLHTHPAIREDFNHSTFEFEHFFLSHLSNPFANQFLNKAAGSVSVLTGPARPPDSSPSFGWSISDGSSAVRYHCRLWPADAH